MAYDEQIDQPQMDDGASQQAPQEPTTALSILQTYLSMPNIAELGSEALEANTEGTDNPHTLESIGQLVCQEYEYDKTSRSDWELRMEEGLRLARQLKGNRTYAGEPIADVRYPTIAQAAIQYHSRAYPAIVKEGEVVKYKPIGADPEGMKSARGVRVSQYMNWAVLEDMSNWEEDMDVLLLRQPVVGTYFKKTYPDVAQGKPVCSELVDPEDLVMYYNAASFEKCTRKTHVLYMTHNEYLEQVRSGLFSDAELDRPDPQADCGMHTFLEQHRTLDLDGDGYEEPYVVTVDQKSQKVLRIYCRFGANDVLLNGEQQVRKIIATEYFTEYPFMPSFDGGVYGMGFGILLGPLNESINTLFNQILDAGTRANFQGGFIGRGVRLLRGGESGSLQFKKGEWKFVQATGDDLRKNIFPLPANEPSAVLFQLLGFLVAASEKLAAQSDLLSGIQEQHNVPATSTMALMEQGLKVLAGIYKRVYRSLRKEFRKIHRYIGKQIDDPTYRNIIDDQQGTVADWAMADYDILPMSTSAEMLEAQKYIMAQALLQLKNQGLDDMEINKYYLEALGVPNIQRFLPKQQPPPPPQFVIAMRELDLRERELGVKELEARSKDAKVAAEIREMRERAIKLRADSIKALADAESKEPGKQMNSYHDEMVKLLSEIFEWEQRDEANRKQMEAVKTQLAQAQAAQQQAAQGPQQGGPQGAPPAGPPMGG